MAQIRMDSDKPLKDRMKSASDSPAESTFEEVWPDRWLRTGYDSPNWDTGDPVGGALPRLITAEPDYLANGPSGTYWVEVMGCGNAMVKSLKVHKLDFLRQYQYFYDINVALFVWNSKHKNWAAAWLDDVLQSPQCRDIRTLPKRKGDARAYPYYHWSWSDFRDVAFLKGTKR